MSLAFAIAVISSFVAVPALRADEWNQAAKVKFNEAVEIPGSVLPAGTYWFVLANDDANRNLVQIFSSDCSVLYATLDTIPKERQTSTSDSTFTFAERPFDRPEAVLTWFYPGETTGHEFIYSRNEEREVARDIHQTINAGFQGYAGFAGGH
jgi:hypothetical protein